jgi:hypothetical protein
LIGYPTNGYNLELGDFHPPEFGLPKLENPEKYEYFFRDHIFPYSKKVRYFNLLEHVNYIGMTSQKKPVIVSISLKDQEKGEKAGALFRAVIRTPEVRNVRYFSGS